MTWVCNIAGSILTSTRRTRKSMALGEMVSLDAEADVERSDLSSSGQIDTKTLSSAW